MLKKYFFLAYILVSFEILTTSLVFIILFRFLDYNSRGTGKPIAGALAVNTFLGPPRLFIIGLIFIFLIIILNILLFVLILKIEKDKSYDHLEKMALTDSLTGLYNRRYFDSLYENLFSQSSRYNIPLSLIMCDIDHFKRINDSYGHDRGDIVLKKIAEVLKNSVRKSDTVVRFGGEEFIICLPSTSIVDAVDVARKLNQAILKINFNEPETITVSLGVVSYRKDFENRPKDLLKQVDNLLYEAKNRGRNRIISEDSYGDIIEVNENMWMDAF